MISRALGVGRGAAKRSGLAVSTGGGFWVALRISPFLHEIAVLPPDAVQGDSRPTLLALLVLAGGLHPTRAGFVPASVLIGCSGRKSNLVPARSARSAVELRK